MIITRLIFRRSKENTVHAIIVMLQQQYPDQIVKRECSAQNTIAFIRLYVRNPRLTAILLTPQTIMERHGWWSETFQQLKTPRYLILVEMIKGNTKDSQCRSVIFLSKVPSYTRIHHHDDILTTSSHRSKHLFCQNSHFD